MFMTLRKSRHYVLAGCLLATTAIAAGHMKPGMAAPDGPSVQVAQTLPTPLPPIPYASNGAALPSEQYVVLVNGNSDLLLDQVRQIEPGAFVNFVDGGSVIQAGRFNSLQNAQLRADELAVMGIGAQVQPTASVSAPLGNTPSAYPSSVPPASASVPASPTPSVPASPTASVPASTTGSLPPLPVAATSSSVEFGQAPPFQSVNTAPPSAYPANAASPPTSAPSTAQPPARASGYYVVVPGRSADLPSLANQVVTLGAAPSLVQTRTAPRGPHVAVGPYADQGIAQEWSSYLRDSGLDARVHFE
ncbi:MAG: hypothetical protein F6J95_005175 [Leptolyngbya sp. SIO1E4]|nr:hypothetical protein [Leptolyngbya sp. SIO1E4]